MPLTCAVICPEPPFLLAGLAGESGESGESGAPEAQGAATAASVDPVPRLREACRSAIAWLGIRLSTPSSGPHLQLAGPSPGLVPAASADDDTPRGVTPSLVVVGGGPQTTTYAADAPFSAGPFLGTGAVPGSMPVSLGLARELLDAGARSCGGTPLPAVRRATYHSIASDAPTDECCALGAALAGDDDVAMLVMADGSGRGAILAPNRADPEAAAYDACWIDALCHGDPAGLAELDTDLAEAVSAGGRAALQVLAGAAGSASFLADVRYDGAPFGVRYAVVTWQPDGETGRPLEC